MVFIKDIKKNKTKKISEVLINYESNVKKIKTEFLSLRKLNGEKIDQRKIEDIQKKLYV